MVWVTVSSESNEEPIVLAGVWRYRLELNALIYLRENIIGLDCHLPVGARKRTEHKKGNLERLPNFEGPVTIWFAVVTQGPFSTIERFNNNNKVVQNTSSTKARSLCGRFVDYGSTFLGERICNAFFPRQLSF